jgi:hypothetical protein
MSGTILILLLAVVGAPVVDGSIAQISGKAFSPFCSLASPGYLFSSARLPRFTGYWSALAVTGGLIAFMFALATFLVRRTWQVRAGRKTRSEANAWLYAAKYGGSKSRRRARARLLDNNPVMWLASRERWQAMSVWALSIATAAIAVWASGESATTRVVSGYGGWLLSAVVWFWAASQSCRFFFEARKSGLVELLLVGPLDERRIVQGHWRALGRRFAIPVAILVCVQVAAAFFRQSAFRSMAPAPAQASVLMHAALVAGIVASAITFIGNLVAIGWVGMWLGLTSRSANSATLKTLLFVQVIPWFGASFTGVMAVPLMLFSRGGGRVSSNWAQFWPYITIFTTAAIYLVKNIAFIVWARNSLYNRFRIEATRSYSVLKPAVVPPSFPAGPPVLAR